MDSSYFAIGGFWLLFISFNFAFLRVKGFSNVDAVTYAWGLFFVAHALYELPYMVYYQFFSSYYISPIVLYLSVSGFFFLLWLGKHYPTSLNLFLSRALPVGLALSSLTPIFAIFSGFNILGPDYGMNLFCWCSRIIAVACTSLITVGVGHYGR